MDLKMHPVDGCPINRVGQVLELSLDGTEAGGWLTFGVDWVVCSLLPEGEDSLFPEGRFSLLPKGTVSADLIKA